MTAAPRRSPLGTLLALGGLGLLLLVGLWRAGLLAAERRRTDLERALKTLTVSGRVPPSQEVMTYLRKRHEALVERAEALRRRVVAEPKALEGADPQLYYQEQFHAMERTLERLTAARGTATPERLGFPKELPPSDTVPRLLVQVRLIEEAAALVLEQGITGLSAVKVEDPEPGPAADDGTVFVTRLPVSLRFRGALPNVLQTFAAVQRLAPLADIRIIRLVGEEGSDQLDTELVLARYLPTAPIAAGPGGTDGPAGSPREPHAGPAARSKAPRKTPARTRAP